MTSEEKPHPSIKRPRDAATLVIVRGGSEVLMGVRSSAHAFMPNKYVFPGGRVDRADGQVVRPVDLRGDVAEKLERGCSAHRARAVAMAAVRETFEESGLILGTKMDEAVTTRAPHWRPFYETGFVPALDKVDYIARAITPPGRPRRFDARFFMVDAAHLSGSLEDSAELSNLTWVPLAEARELDLPNITKLMIQLIERRLEDGGHRKPGAKVPLVRTVRGRHMICDH